MAALTLMTASEKELAWAMTKPIPVPSPPARPVTASEYASMLTRMAMRADAALVHGDIEAHVRAMCHQLIRASKWIVDAERRATAAEKQLMVRGMEVAALREALEVEMVKRSDAEAAAMASDTESSRSDIEIDVDMDIDGCETNFVNGDEMDDSMVAEHKLLTEHVVSNEDAEHALEQELAQSELRCAQLCERVESLETLVEEQSELLSLASVELHHCDAESRWLRSDVSWLVGIKHELEQKQDELVRRVQVLESNEAYLRYEMEKAMDEKLLRVSEHEDVVREYEELVRRMQSELVDLRSEILFVAEQKIHSGTTMPEDSVEPTNNYKDESTDVAMSLAFAGFDDVAAAALKVKMNVMWETKVDIVDTIPMNTTSSELASTGPESVKVDSPRAARHPLDTVTNVAAASPALKASVTSSKAVARVSRRSAARGVGVPVAATSTVTNSWVQQDLSYVAKSKKTAMQTTSKLPPTTSRTVTTKKPATATVTVNEQAKLHTSVKRAPVLSRWR